MNPPKSRQLKSNTASSIILYSVISILGGWRIWCVLRSTLNFLSLPAYITVYLILCATLPISICLPHSKVSKSLEIIGSYWTCVQLTFFFASAVEWFLKKLLVDWMRLLSAVQFLWISIFTFSFTALMTGYGIVHAKRIHLTSYHCSTSKHLDGRSRLHIVQISDLHLGAINDSRTVKKIVRKVNVLKPDLICITGDTFSTQLNNVADLDATASDLHELKSVYGVVACLGNHDYHSGQENIGAFFESANITLLQDQQVQVAGIVLVGRGDLAPEGGNHQTRRTIPELFNGLDLEQFVVVLDHQPGDLSAEMEAGADMVLSGHTHGGQFFPIHLCVKFFFPHYYGCKKFGETYSIVSSGSSTAIPPIRIGSKSEIVSIVIEHK